ncbi:MAG: HEAT repeat domain-containing protein [Acidobacteriia bacterium]|nr:HEAT repeat domain-containing protein [Terriglobia bacterium]
MTSNETWRAVEGLLPPGGRLRLKPLEHKAAGASFVEFARAALEGDVAAGKMGALSVALLESDAVLRALSEPSLSSLEEAAALARAAVRLDERIDARLLTSLTAASVDWPRDVPMARAGRALEMIDLISDCRRLVMPLIKFTKIPDPKIRSKAVKLIARASQNGGWVESVLSDPDPRVRSNLIEGLVRQMGRGAEQLLRRAARDAHHRVSTTSLLALAQFGDEPAREELQKLAADPREMHRRAAEWALGKLAEAAAPSYKSPAIEAAANESAKSNPLD